MSSNSVDKLDRETGTRFMPKFGGDGLLTAVVVDSRTRQVRMVAFMDQEALDKSIETGLAHFHSRSRSKLWLKGESSGNLLRIQEILVDCDQDALILTCDAAGPTCHTGTESCFFRRLKNGSLEPVGA